MKGSGLYFVHNDHLTRAEVITDKDQNTVWRANNYAFDHSVSVNQIGDYNLGFPGQYYDEETGLYYNYFRDYDPSTGRYIQSDPIGLAAGVNTYTYVHANPVSLIDPYGLAAAASNCTYKAPTDNPHVTSPYTTGNRTINGVSRRHTATDYRNGVGNPVYSLWDGTVSAIRTYNQAGNNIRIDHPNGFQSSYSHTASIVKAGDQVTAGQHIDNTDLSGRITGPHLHLVLKDPQGNRVDPEPYINHQICP